MVSRCGSISVDRVVIRMGYKTEQEKFWAGEFGDAYIERNKSQELKASNINFFAGTLAKSQQINTILEFGSNIGMNMLALEALYPKAKKTAVEINEKAAGLLKEAMPQVRVLNESILDFQPVEKFDLVFTKGVLIHISPEHLSAIYKKIVGCSKRYILIAEYFNPRPVTMEYRGHDEKLYKRDFCGDLLDSYDLDLIDYGFSYKRDPKFRQDNINWFLLEKKK